MISTRQKIRTKYIGLNIMMWMSSEDETNSSVRVKTSVFLRESVDLDSNFPKLPFLSVPLNESNSFANLDRHFVHKDRHLTIVTFWRIILFFFFADSRHFQRVVFFI